MEGKRRATVGHMLLFFGLITLFFCLVIQATMPKYKSCSTAEEIAAADLSRDYICPDSSAAKRYPGRLYDSEDFLAGNTVPGDEEAKFETCRLLLRLKPGITYGILGQTATYAQWVYVNGELLPQVGRVSADPEDNEQFEKQLHAEYCP